MDKNKIRKLLKETEQIISSDSKSNDKLMKICKLLWEEVEHYNWVGYYFVDKENPNQLILGPYAGEETEHTTIEFGKGICGQAAEKQETFVVRNVENETNYLSCSINVKSEIVVPIFKNNQLVGEIDIDSHYRSPFTEYDINFLEKLASISAIVL